MDDLLGWQQTRWGMTNEEIVAVVGSQHLRKQEREGGPKDFWYCDLVIQNVDIGGFFFNIQFRWDEIRIACAKCT